MMSAGILRRWRNDPRRWSFFRLSLRIALLGDHNGFAATDVNPRGQPVAYLSISVLANGHYARLTPVVIGQDLPIVTQQLEI
jgi:hypothetical protein